MAGLPPGNRTTSVAGVSSPLLDTTQRSLRRLALDRQREGRVPGLFAGVQRDGQLVWGEGIGTTDVSDRRTPGPDDQFLVASNTKTFTAVMVMQLRDAGRLSLDDPIAAHVPEVTHPVTVRQGLSHLSGLQREPVGDIWETLARPDTAELLSGFTEAEQVGRPHDRWHYSNVVSPCSATSCPGSTAARGPTRCRPGCSTRWS